LLKTQVGRHFSSRGIESVFTEVLLYAFAFNINKRHNKNEREFEGVIRHTMKVS
jgi:hypothetical protein